MKFKKLTKQQIIISIDRLTRFKPTEEKYLRVYSDIILNNLIEPKIKKADLNGMEYSEIRDIATEIFNSSLDTKSNDYSINSILKDYENKVFINNTNTKTLLDNTLDYKSAIKLIDTKTDVLNLQWLISLCNKKRKNVSEIKKLVIAEGITEEILLPAFAKKYDYDFIKNGIKIMAAGGKNQVVKLYYKLVEQVKIPMFILLDKDAEINENLINTKLRKQDKVHLLECGEFEDLLPLNLIIKTINNEFKNFVSVKKSDFNKGMPMVKALEELYKERCLHEFKKAEFAQRIKQQIASQRDISPELKNIIEGIKTL